MNRVESITALFRCYETASLSDREQKREHKASGLTRWLIHDQY